MAGPVPSKDHVGPDAFVRAGSEARQENSGALLRWAGEDTCPYVSIADYCGSGAACCCGMTEAGTSARGATNGMLGMCVTSPRSASLTCIPA
jgi:hypothetical protein